MVKLRPLAEPFFYFAVTDNARGKRITDETQFALDNHYFQRTLRRFKVTSNTTRQRSI